MTSGGRAFMSSTTPPPAPDRHAPAASLPPEERTGVPWHYSRDPLEDICPACTPILDAGRWAHDGGCAMRNRPL